MKRANCYNIIAKDGKIFYKKGIPCDGIFNDNKLIINGLGVYRLFTTPIDIDITDISKAEKGFDLKFRDYNASDPWIGCENDGKYYLYGANIEKDHLYLKAPSTDKPNTEYVLVHAPIKYDVHVLGDASIFFRRFEGDEVVSLLEIRGPSIIDLEAESGLIMIEPLENGKFVCR